MNGLIFNFTVVLKTWPLQLGKIFCSTANCKVNPQFARKFSRTNGRPSKVFHIFCSNRLEQKVLFHLHGKGSFPAIFNVCR